jgi:hypothetical protein
MKRLVVMLMALLLVSAPAFADAADPGRSLSVRTFTFKHKQAENAAAVIKSLMSADGTMSIQPKTNSLVVTDEPANVKKIAAALAEFDTAPMPFRLSVYVISAGRTAPSKASRIPEELRDVEEQLSLLRYTDLAPLGGAEVVAKEGEPGLVELTQYRAAFTFGQYDPSSDSVSLADFKLSRLDGDQLTQLTSKAGLNLKLGQTVALGITRDAKSQRALFLVLSARR